MRSAWPHHPATLPAEVGSDNDWAAVAAGGDFTLALKKDGTLWACGSNIWGSLGLGDTTDRHSPTQVGSASDWTAVSAGIGYSLALKRDGTLWAWGDNSFGELGLGDTVERTPRPRSAAPTTGRRSAASATTAWP